MILLTCTLILLASFQAGRTKRLVNGEISERVPWMVHLRRSKTFFCGGVLYSQRSIITAAHCSKGNINRWIAHLDRHNIDISVEDDEGQQSKVIEWINHPEYNTTSKEFDISIWKIEDEFNYFPIILETLDYDDLTSEMTVIALGWGETRILEPDFKDSPDYIPQHPSLLQKTNLPIFHSSVCARLYDFFNQDNMLCTGDPGKEKGICAGDSGGPLYRVTRYSTVLVGIISSSRGCGYKEYHNIAVKISAPKVTKFINKYGGKSLK